MYKYIPVDFGVDSLPLVLRVQFWQGRRPAPWGCFLHIAYQIWKEDTLILLYFTAALSLESLMEGHNLFLNQFVGIHRRSINVCFSSLSGKAGLNLAELYSIHDHRLWSKTTTAEAEFLDESLKSFPPCYSLSPIQLRLEIFILQTHATSYSFNFSSISVHCKG